MKYLMKAGILYSENGAEELAKVKGTWMGAEKQIFLPDGTLVLRTDICRPDGSMAVDNGVCFSKYVMFDAAGTEAASASPDYSEEDNPEFVGWPVCRMPRVDHAVFVFQGKQFLLTMQNSQNYMLKDKGGNPILQILHRGLAGGWKFEDKLGLPPAVLCGIFIFCRYLEKENEFLVV